jgi:hypothetical protein
MDTLSAIEVDWVERLIYERADLDARISKLRRFINKGFDDGLSEGAKERLKAQFKVMQAYSMVLTERLTFDV